MAGSQSADLRLRDFTSGSNPSASKSIRSYTTLDRNQESHSNLGDAIKHFADEKKKKTLLESDMSSWRQSIRRQMEADLDRRVREALETPVQERRDKMLQERKEKKKKMEELERMNNEVLERQMLEMRIANSSSKRNKTREQMKTVLADPSKLHQYISSSSSSSGFNSYVPVSSPPTESYSHLRNFLNGSEQSQKQDTERRPSLGLENNTKLKHQDHYASIGEKAMTKFGSMTDTEKHQFYYMFIKSSYREALRRGCLADGSELIPLGRGKYKDKYGLIRDEHGPFWPPDYGPLLPAPQHKRLTSKREELLSSCLEEKNRTIDSQSTQFFGKWRGTQIVFDAERSNKDYEPPPVQEGLCPNLAFESRFECGNLRQARRVGQFEYELVLKTDLYTIRHTQWFYFRVRKAIPGITYKFKIVNLLKRDSLYNHGMRPLMYSERNVDQKGVGWLRVGHHISYSRNVSNLQCPLLSREMAYYMLEWQMEFTHSDDTCYFAHCYPYTYTDLKNDMENLIKDPERSKVIRHEVLCETRAGNSAFLLTVTDFDKSDHDKKGIVVTARVHPGETNSSYMMKGLLEFITSNAKIAVEIRKKCIFKIVPMLNPDGVIVGNYRCSLAGRDLNRNYRRPRAESFPTIFYTKMMMEDFGRMNEIIVYCDLHGHSRKQNVFMYGCNRNQNPKDLAGALGTESFLKERLFPWLMSQKAPDKFWFHGCKFQIKRCKEATGRVVMFRQMNILNSFTMEATFCGTTISKGERRHFNMEDFQQMGDIFGQVALDYWQTNDDKQLEQEAIVNVARIITHQILQSRNLLPPDMPDFTTEAGKQQMADFTEKQKMETLTSNSDRMKAALIDMFNERIDSVASVEARRDSIISMGEMSFKSISSGSPTLPDEVSERKSDNKQKGPSGNMLAKAQTRSSGMDVKSLLSSMVKPSVGGCLKVLEQLNVQDTIIESDFINHGGSSSSDSDSESEPEMKWSNSNSKRKKKRKKNKKEKDRLKKSKPSKQETELPALKAEDDENKDQSNQGMGKYVKNFIKHNPRFVNRYSSRSNGGIPCYAQERLIERTAKRMADMQRKFELQKHQAMLNYNINGIIDDSNFLHGETRHLNIDNQYDDAFLNGIHFRSPQFPHHEYSSLLHNEHYAGEEPSSGEEQELEVLPHHQNPNAKPSSQQRDLARSNSMLSVNMTPRNTSVKPLVRSKTVLAELGHHTVFPGSFIIKSQSQIDHDSQETASLSYKAIVAKEPSSRSTHQMQTINHGSLQIIKEDGIDSSKTPLTYKHGPPNIMSREYTNLLIHKLNSAKATATGNAESLRIQPKSVHSGKTESQRHSTCE